MSITSDLLGEIIKSFSDWVNAKISLFKLSLGRNFKTLQQFVFACFKLLDSVSSKSYSEKLQHQVLADNCQLKTSEICCAKLLLRMLTPFLFKWSVPLFRWLALIFFTLINEKKVFSSISETVAANLFSISFGCGNGYHHIII